MYLRLEVKFIIKRRKSMKGNKIRSNQIYTEYYTWPNEVWKNQDEAFRYFKNKYSNFVGCKIK